jgi:hypothetical protein
VENTVWPHGVGSEVSDGLIVYGYLLCNRLGKLTATPPLDLVVGIKENTGETMLTDWRVAAAAAVFCTGLLVTCIETSAQSMPKDVAARTEIYAIPSLTISDQQFLTGASRSPSPANSASRRAAENYPSWC